MMTQLNDFMFCPRSIFFSRIYHDSVSDDLFHQECQTQGLAAHAAVDENRYSSRKSVISVKMFLIVYDIESDRLRGRFAKFLKRFGRRLQYSVFEIANSPRVLENIRIEIKSEYEKKFSQGDSVLIINVPDNAVIDRFGYAQNEESDLLIF